MAVKIKKPRQPVIRLTPEVFVSLVRYADKLSRRAGGVKVTPNQAIRVLLKGKK